MADESHAQLFFRHDHFRDHLRDFHKEDLPRRGAHLPITVSQEKLYQPTSGRLIAQDSLPEAKEEPKEAKDMIVEVAYRSRAYRTKRYVDDKMIEIGW